MDDEVSERSSDVDGHPVIETALVELYRETGEALVGIELGSAAEFEGLLGRMEASEIHVEALEPGSPAYRYLT